jgi:hypothetical protein
MACEASGSTREETTMAEKSMAEQLEEVQLKTALMNMRIAEQAVEKFEAEERAKSVQRKDRQAGFRSKVRGRANIAAGCSHKAGASQKNIYKGKGDTTLKKVRMMDGFTLIIHCAICRLMVFSPHPYDRNPALQKNIHTGKMETAAQAKARVEKWTADTAKFEKLLEQSEESKSDEYSSTMDCGNTFTVTDEQGLPVFRRRPSDFYPQAVA